MESRTSRSSICSSRPMFPFFGHSGIGEGSWRGFADEGVCPLGQFRNIALTSFVMDETSKIRPELSCLSIIFTSLFVRSFEALKGEDIWLTYNLICLFYFCLLRNQTSRIARYMMKHTFSFDLQRLKMFRKHSNQVGITFASGSYQDSRTNHQKHFVSENSRWITRFSSQP